MMKVERYGTTALNALKQKRKNSTVREQIFVFFTTRIFGGIGVQGLILEYWNASYM